MVVGDSNGENPISVAGYMASQREILPYLCRMIELIDLPSDSAINCGNSNCHAFKDTNQYVGVASQSVKQGVEWHKIEAPILLKAMEMTPNQRNFCLTKMELTVSASQFLKPTDIIFSFGGLAIVSMEAIPLMHGDQSGKHNNDAHSSEQGCFFVEFLILFHNHGQAWQHSQGQAEYWKLLSGVVLGCWSPANNKASGRNNYHRVSLGEDVSKRQINGFSMTLCCCQTIIQSCAILSVIVDGWPPTTSNCLDTEPVLMCLKNALADAEIETELVRYLEEHNKLLRNGLDAYDAIGNGRYVLEVAEDVHGKISTEQQLHSSRRF
ncbi:Protease Do-like 9 [Nymphaea thermarum]|nr:Protease Do-like 9 [Nymphaea thermarum]